MMNEQFAECVPREPGFNQVCIWPALLVNKPEEFVQQMQEHFGVRIQYLETIYTKPDLSPSGFAIAGTGGSADVFFAVHDLDVGKFAVRRLQFGIRWLDDAIAEINGGNTLYPERVSQYLLSKGESE